MEIVPAASDDLVSLRFVWYYGLLGIAGALCDPAVLIILCCSVMFFWRGLEIDEGCGGVVSRLFSCKLFRIFEIYRMFIKFFDIFDAFRI